MTCQECKKILDPYWYLNLLAKEWAIRRYQDAEAIEAYRALKQQHLNALARGGNKAYVRPKEGKGLIVWDSYEAYHGHPPEYVYTSGRYWYAGENGSAQAFEFIQSLLANKHNNYKITKDEFINLLLQNNEMSKWLAEHIYDEGFKNGREYERELQ